MRNYPVCLLLLAASIGTLSAQRTATGVLHVSAHVEGSISVIFNAGGGSEPVTAIGSRSAALNVPVYEGSFSRQAQPLIASDGSFLISSPFTLEVVKANLLSANYTLKAWLNTSDSTHSWRIDGVDISTGNVQTIATSEFYGNPNPHTMVVSGPAQPNHQPMSNSLNLQVTAN